VVGREGIGVTDLEMTPFSLASLDSAQIDVSLLYGGKWTPYYVLFEEPSFQDIAAWIVGQEDDNKEGDFVYKVETEQTPASDFVVI